MKPPFDFIAVPKAVVARADMRPSEKFLLGALISGAKDDGTYRVRIETLAKNLGIEYRTARAALIRLEGLGFISIKATGKASLYTIKRDWHACASQESRDAQMCQSDGHTRDSQTGTPVPVDHIRTSFKNFLEEGAATTAARDSSFEGEQPKEIPFVWLCATCEDLGIVKTARPPKACSCSAGETYLKLQRDRAGQGEWRGQGPDPAIATMVERRWSAAEERARGTAA